MTETKHASDDVLNGLRWPLRITRAGMVAERVTRAFWPLWSLVLLVLSTMMLGGHETLSVEAAWVVAVVIGAAGLWFTVSGIRRFRWPSRAEAIARLDRTLPDRPLSAIRDTQIIGAGDLASEAVWRAHIDRMAERARHAQAVEPDLRLSNRDPYALRYVAVLAFLVAVLFGSILKVASVTSLGPALGGGALATGPTWEGWIEPPLYTGKPSLYLNDLPKGDLSVPVGSQLTLRLYGEVGDLTVAETVSGRTGEISSAADSVQQMNVTRSGELRIDGPGGAAWKITVIPDRKPQVQFSADVETTMGGEMRQAFSASDDYGIVSGQAIIALDLDAIDRRYGLAAQPEARDPVILDLPLPISGDRADFEETLVENFAGHPWAGLPVTLRLEVTDSIGQTARSASSRIILPGRRFFDPLARAVVEQRRDLLWSRDNTDRITMILRALTHRPEGLMPSETAYLKLRFAIRRLERALPYGISDKLQAQTAQAFWDIALLLEDGNLSDARERLRRAQDRLSEATRRGASDEEIAELMQELRDAMQDYMQQLAQEQRQNPNQQAQNQQTQEITGDQLQQMLDRIQELMEQGRMQEAQQMLDQLRQMLENLQVTEGSQGNQQSPGQRAMEGLQETLRQQQGLSDEAFRNLQEQFNPGAQAGQSGENEGLSGGDGRGQSHEGRGGQGEDGQQNGNSGQSGQSLADRQQALRDELQRQRNSLPGAGTPEGDAARNSLGRAGDAMEGAENALRRDDLAGAIDDQAEALEALRDGMRELSEALAQEQRRQNGRQGEALGRAGSQQQDPLGRDLGTNGSVGSNEQLLQGEDVYRRARELLDEIRNRSSDRSRPRLELDYLKRLLDRF